MIGYNKRTIELPINISIIKKYCLSSEIKKEQVYDAHMWIAIRYSGIIKCIEWQEYFKNYNENKKLK